MSIEAENDGLDGSVSSSSAVGLLFVLVFMNGSLYLAHMDFRSLSLVIFHIFVSLMPLIFTTILPSRVKVSLMSFLFSVVVY